MGKIFVDRAKAENVSITLPVKTLGVLYFLTSALWRLSDPWWFRSCGLTNERGGEMGGRLRPGDPTGRHRGCSVIPLWFGRISQCSWPFGSFGVVRSDVV